MKVYSQKSILCALALLFGAQLCAETNYDIINTGLTTINPSLKAINQKSSQIEVNKACNAQKNYIIAELKRAKPGSQARKQLLEDQGIINAACGAIDTSAKRDAYQKSLDKQKADEKKAAEDKKKQEAEKNKKAIEEDPVLGDVKLPSESDPNFIQKLTGRVKEKVSATASNIKGKVKGEIEKQKKDADVKVFNLVGNFLSKINIPPAGFKVFGNDFAMKDIKFLQVPSGESIRTGLGFTGTAQFNKFAVKATVFVVQDKDKKIQYSISMELPDDYKISSLFPNFKKLDAIPIPKGMIVASTFNYMHPDAYAQQSVSSEEMSIHSAGGMQSASLTKGGYAVEKGFNFIGSLSLTGPLRALGELRKKAKEFDSIVFDFDAPLYIQGVIPSMTAAKFKGVVPMRLGMDFQKLKKIPKGFSDIFKKITTDDIIIEVAITPSDQRFGAQSGIRIYLGTQPEPVRIQAFGGIDILSGKINFGGKVPDMVELKWLAIGDFGIEMYLDPAVEAVLAFFGVPISGLAFRGRIDLGKKGDTRASLSMASKVSLETKKALDYAFNVSGKNLQFAELVSLLTKMSAKAGIGKEIPSSKIPTMTISEVSGRVAIYDTEIAGTKIPAGFQLKLDAQLFDKKFGFDVDIRHLDLTFKGTGYMSEIAFKNGKNTVFKLSGPGPDQQYGTPDDGPIVACSFDAKNPLAGSFSIHTMLDIPPLGLKNKVDLEIEAKKFKVDFDSTYLGFTTSFGINIEPAKWKEMYIKFGFKGDFEKFLSQQAKPAIEALRRDATQKLAEVDKKIGQLAGELEKVKKEQTKAKNTGVSQTEREMEKTKKTIAIIHKKIADLKRECDKANPFAKIGVCPKVGIEIAAQGVALAAQETYLNTLLKPGKEVIKGTMNALNAINETAQKASKALSEAKIFQKSINEVLTGLSKATEGLAKGASIFKVTEAAGGISATDLAVGKMPKLEVLKASVDIPGLKKLTVDLKDLQFDFKKPGPSAVDIAKKLLGGIKLG